MIEVKNLKKSFKDGDSMRQVLFGIDAKFYDGKTNLIIGQSGSGKTVLVKNIAILEVKVLFTVMHGTLEQIRKVLQNSGKMVLNATVNLKM